VPVGKISDTPLGIATADTTDMQTIVSDETVITITVDVVNDTPIAANDTFHVSQETTLVVDGLGVLGNDIDVAATRLRPRWYRRSRTAT
jgi:hypothetical protein